MEHRNSNHYIPNNQISIEKYTGTSHQRILAKLT